MSLSIAYFVFLAVALPLYFVLPKRCRSVFLLVASIVFYAFCPWQSLAVMAALIAVTYAAGRGVGAVIGRQNATLAAHRTDGSWDKETRRRYRNVKQRQTRAVLATAVTLQLLCLVCFKLSWPERLGGDAWTVPLGLSFVTLSAIGYLVDVARGRIEAEQKFWRVALFLLYFPQMWQGPIHRYAQLSPELCTPHTFDAHRARAGMLRAMWGLIKKMIFANTAALATSAILADQTSLGGAGMWLLVLIYSVRIYADFTGGMDVALGVSQVLGISMSENFDRPFASPSLKEYWRRWHRTMGRWFEDYVFYPLSLSRPMQRLSLWSRAHLGQVTGRYLPLTVAMLATWCATGLWHGISWNFVLWGLFNGILLLLSQLLTPWCRRLRGRYSAVAESRAWYVLSCAATVFTAGLLRTLDLNPRAGATLQLWGQMLHPSAFIRLTEGALWRSLGLNSAQWGVLVLGVIAMAIVGRLTPRPNEQKTPLRERLAARPLLCAALLALGAVSVAVLGVYGLGYDAGSFIYGEF